MYAMIAGGSTAHLFHGRSHLLPLACGQLRRQLRTAPSVCAVGFSIWVLVFRLWGLGISGEDLGTRVWGSRFRVVKCLWFTVSG